MPLESTTHHISGRRRPTKSGSHCSTSLPLPSTPSPLPTPTTLVVQARGGVAPDPQTPDPPSPPLDLWQVAGVRRLLWWPGGLRPWPANGCEAALARPVASNGGGWRPAGRICHLVCAPDQSRPLPRRWPAAPSRRPEKGPDPLLYSGRSWPGRSRVPLATASAGGCLRPARAWLGHPSSSQI